MIPDNHRRAHHSEEDQLKGDDDGGANNGNAKISERTLSASPIDVTTHHHFHPY